MKKVQSFSPQFMDGWHAHRRGLAVSFDNPYDEQSQSYSNALWENGWTYRHNAIEHGADPGRPIEDLDEDLGFGGL